MQNSRNTNHLHLGADKPHLFLCISIQNMPATSSALRRRYGTLELENRDLTGDHDCKIFSLGYTEVFRPTDLPLAPVCVLPLLPPLLI